MNNKAKTTIQMTSAVLVVAALVVTVGMTSVLATHVSGVEDYEWHIWSRDAGDGHRNYLNCSGNDCDLKIKTLSGGIQIHSQTTINAEVNAVESHFDSLGKNMSIDRVSSASSYITEANLPPGTAGKAEYDLHCTSYWWWWCDSEDSHFERMIVKINNNPNEFKFMLEEDASADPLEYDIRKTLGHELFHAMGIDHNPSSNSIVYYQYVFGANNGYTATTTDRNDLESRYP